MIFTERKITIRNGKSTINEPVVLYRGDYEVSIKFTIMESKFRFKSGANLVDSEKASHGQLAILAPYGGNVFSEIVKCEDGTVTFTLTKEMIDQLEEVGLYSFQIRLFDYYRESRVSIPPVEFGIEVREPVASEDHDNSVNNAIVGYSIAKVVDGLNEDVGPTFDADGQYNKTDWETGDRISQGKLNKIEDAIDTINRNEKNNVAALDKRVTNNFNILEANKAEQVDLLTERKRIDSLASLKDGSTTGDAELMDGRISASGTTYTSIGESIREQVKTATGECVSIPYTMTAGGYIMYNNGTVANHTDSFRYSNYVELIPGVTDIYITNINYKDADSAGLAFYKANKSFLKGHRYGVCTDIKLEVPADAKYLRFTTRSDTKGEIRVYQKVMPSLVSLLNDVDLLKRGLIEKKELTTNPNLVNSYITRTGGVISDGSPYKVSEPVSIKNGSRLIITAAGYQTNVAILSVFLGNNKYLPLVISKDSVSTSYEFIVDSDMEVCVCSQDGIAWELVEVKGNAVDNDSLSTELEYDTLQGYIQYTNGVQIINGAPTHLFATNHVYIKNMSKLYVEGLNYANTDSAGLSFYGEEQEFLSGVRYTPCVDLEVDIPKEACYVRLTGRLDSRFKLKVRLTDMVNGLMDNKMDKSTTIQHKFELTSMYYIRYTDGQAISHTSEGYQMTDYITLESGYSTLEVVHGANGADLSGMAFYDHNMLFISGIQNSSSGMNIVDIPDNAVYVRCTIMARATSPSISSTMFVMDAIQKLSDDVQAIKNDNDITVKSPYNYCQIFHKIAGIGDSLMSGEIGTHGPGEEKKWYDRWNYSWLSNLCKNIGAEAVHYSKGGETTKSWLSNFLTDMKNESIKPSAYFIALGTNDKTYVTLGSEADCDTDAETFYGMYSKIIKEVQTFNPNAAIFCVSLYFSPNDAGTINFSNAVKYMADKYGCYYIDFISNHPEYSSGNIKNLFVSNGHFTTPGYVRVGQDMLDLANQVIYNNPNEFKFRFIARDYGDLK